MAEGLDNYASPILRMAVFNRLYPGSTVEYEIVSMDEAFPASHRTYEGKATHAVRCTIIRADGTWVSASKEMDTVDRNRPVQPTPEQLAKDQTKALGRTLRDAGIPQKASELQTLMRWIAAMSGQPVQTVGLQNQHQVVDTSTGEITQGVSAGEEIDDADAGSDESPYERLVARIREMDGPARGKLATTLKERFDVRNVLRPPTDKTDEINQIIDEQEGT